MKTKIKKKIKDLKESGVELLFLMVNKDGAAMSYVTGIVYNLILLINFN